jgi:ABC-2 type transport system permease protein
VTGHGERGLTDTGAQGLAQLATTLTASNYGGDRISLLEGIPETCTVLVVAAPQQALTEVELEQLHNYLAAGGRVALFLEPDPAPSLGAWLQPFGVSPESGSVVDTSGAGRSVGGGPRTPLALRYVDHPVTRGFEIATIYSGARPLRTLETHASGARVTALAQTGPRSFSTRNPEPEPSLQEGTDTPGPLTLVTAVAVGGASQPGTEGRLVVFGDADVVSNAFLRRQGNRDFFLRSLSWLMGEEEATIVSVDDRQNRRIELTERARAWMYIVNLGALPLLPLLAGVFVHLRSQRRAGAP